MVQFFVGYMKSDDIFALLDLLKETSNDVIASYTLHCLRDIIYPGSEVLFTLKTEEIKQIAMTMTKEAVKHRYHLQDAAIYVLGSILTSLFSHLTLVEDDIIAYLQILSDNLLKYSQPDQCRVLLTIFSCLSGDSRIRKTMATDGMTSNFLFQLLRQTNDPNLQARAFSIIKVLNENHDITCNNRIRNTISPDSLSLEGVWYFGGDESPTPN